MEAASGRRGVGEKSDARKFAWVARAWNQVPPWIFRDHFPRYRAKNSISFHSGGTPSCLDPPRKPATSIFLLAERIYELPSEQAATLQNHRHPRAFINHRRVISRVRQLHSVGGSGRRGSSLTISSLLTRAEGLEYIIICICIVFSRSAQFFITF